MEKSTISAGAPGSPVNDALSKAVRNYSNFNIVRRRYETMRFGDITPHFVMEGVSTDSLPLQSSHDLRTYTMSNILMSEVKMHKEYFAVNYDAILPNHWEKVLKNPLRGDDVDWSVNSCIPISSIRNMIDICCSTIADFVTDDDPSWNSSSVPGVLVPLFLLEYLCGSGSLVRYLGSDFSGLLYQLPSSFWEKLPELSHLRYKDFNMVDWIVDQVLSDIASNNRIFGGYFYSVTGSSDDDPSSTPYTVDPYMIDVNGDSYAIPFRDFIQRVREQPKFSFNWAGEEESPSISSVIVDFFTHLDIRPFDSEEYFNFSRLAAYQLVCAEYFTNDHIDYIYSSELFIQLQRSLADAQYYQSDGEGLPNFTWNGVRCQYDALSGKVLFDMFNYIQDNDFSFSDCSSALAYVFNLFSYRRSLRFRDYFVGSHATPLALGDTNVAVNNDLVSVIDTTKGIAYQRFLNQVARIGLKTIDYLRGLFPGVKVEKDIHQPQWLARTDHLVKPVENENTAEEQYELESSVTSVLRSSDGRYIFDFNVGRPCILLGLTYYDVPRAYSRTNDLQTLASDRFDMFIPELQFIGDQPVRGIELGRFDDSVFAYTLRDMQWKQSFDIACGGFVDNLPGWCFLSPNLKHS